MRYLTALAIGVLLSSGAPTPLPAATLVLDGSTGADYDAVGDGWFFTTPPNQPPDGVGDMGNNALAVAYKTGVLEMRGMAEFPLASLSALTPAEIQSATLTITIDDVLTTLGPGAEFDNAASTPIAVHHYPADGTVTLGDFAPAGLSVLGTITPGVVTDASLAVSGALPFNVDVTQKLKDALTAGNAAFGVHLATLDSATGTSLDDVSPPGVAGGALPFITIVTVAQTPPVLSSDAQSCQAGIAKAGSKLLAAELKAFGACLGDILKDFAPDSALDPATTTLCFEELDKANPSSKLGKALGKFTDKAAKKCKNLTPADLGSPCDAGAPDLAATVACIRARHEAAAEHAVTGTYAGACNQLTAVGLAAAFPGVCNQ